MQNDDINWFWEIFQKLCLLKDVTPARALKEMELAASLQSKWKTGAFPHDSTLQKISEYFEIETGLIINVYNGLTSANPDMREVYEKNWQYYLSESVSYKSTQDKPAKDVFLTGVDVAIIKMQINDIRSKLKELEEIIDNNK